MAGTSRCSNHGPASVRERNPIYDAHYQSLRKQVLSVRPLICHICGQGVEAIPIKGPFQADHVVPDSLGGRTELSNLKPAHSKCNIAKGGRNRK